MAHDLARLLLAGPNAEVTTWDGQEEVTIEQLIDVPCSNGNVLVLGTDIGATLAEGAELVWSKDELAARNFERAAQRAQKARREP